MSFNQEQSEAAMRDTAIALRTYYNELVAQGFSKGQAMTLVIEFQKVVIMGGR